MLDILRKTTGYFEQKGVPEPRLQAELLMAHVLDCRRLDLYLQFERPLNATELDRLRPLVGRRGRREPLQYILGETEFFGLTLKCDARALIPRPETEELAEALVGHYGATPPATALDLGTGTGALALALASTWPEVTVTAVDASADALALARENAETCGLGNRVAWVESDWFAALGEARFDLIVSNPPYLTEVELGTAEPEVAAYEPAQALVSGADGLDDLRTIIAGAARHLAPGGLLALETGIAQHEALAVLAERAGLERGESRRDLSSRPRFFRAWAASA